MIHPNTEIKVVGPEVGYGVFSTQFIPMGTIVYVKDPLERSISPNAFKELEEPLRTLVDKYSYIDEMGQRILSWDHGKYINHCCNSNTISTGYGFEIALRDIEKGEEITDEYGLFNLEEEMELHCPKPGCRHRVSAQDLDRYADVWDMQIKVALRQINEVEQPLFPIIDEATRKALYSFLQDESQYLSVRFLKNNRSALQKVWNPTKINSI